MSIHEISRQHSDSTEPPTNMSRVGRELANCFIDAELRTKAHEPRIHQPAGFILGVRKQGFHFSSRGVIEQRKESIALCVGRCLDQVRRIVEGQRSVRANCWAGGASRSRASCSAALRRLNDGAR